MEWNVLELESCNDMCKVFSDIMAIVIICEIQLLKKSISANMNGHWCLSRAITKDENVLVIYYS